jgi:prepilin-type N-terminal cleavage/methylation domain-containing protein
LTRDAVPGGRTRVKAFHRSGFTLVEIMVAVVVAGVLMAAGLPSFIHFSRSLSQKQARDLLEGSLRLARQQAVTSHRPIVVAFGNGISTAGVTTYSVHTDVNGDRVKQIGEPWKSFTLPGGTQLTSVSLSPIDTVIFDSSGALAPSVTGGSVVVGGQSGDLDTLLISATGLVYRP